MICVVSALLKLHTLEAAWHVKKKKKKITKLCQSPTGLIDPNVA